MKKFLYLLSITTVAFALFTGCESNNDDDPIDETSGGGSAMANNITGITVKTSEAWVLDGWPEFVESEQRPGSVTANQTIYILAWHGTSIDLTATLKGIGLTKNNMITWSVSYNGQLNTSLVQNFKSGDLQNGASNKFTVSESFEGEYGMATIIVKSKDNPKIKTTIKIVVTLDPR